MRTAIRHAPTVTSHAARPMLTELSSVSTGIFSPLARTAASPSDRIGPGRILANCAKTAPSNDFPPESSQEWGRARFREGLRCPQTVLASVFPTKVEGGASDQI